ELLSSKVKTFLLHVYIKRQQSKFFEESKTNTDNKKIVIQVDYSENFEIKQQDEVQSAHWSSNHAKGVVDGIGGSVKRIVWQQILTKKDKCENAADFINIAKTKTKATIIDEITQEDIDKSKAQLQAFFSKTLSVKFSN
ncbi:unnamed protein product, partial [Rotaria sordida]